MKAMLTDSRDFIAPVHAFDRLEIQAYWEALQEADTLKYRLCDVDNPTIENVWKMYRNVFLRPYFVYDTTKRQLVGEFVLENFMGKAAQIHFSMHPKNESPVSLDIAKRVLHAILYVWQDAESKNPYRETLYGLTPVTNRVACVFVLKAGFKKIGILNKAIRDRGNVVDAMIVQSKRNGNGR